MLSYDLESSDLPSPLGVKAHSTQGMAASKAFLAGVPVQDICDAGGWSTPLTFSRFYDLSHLFPCRSHAFHTLAGICKAGGVDISFPKAFSTQLEFPEGNVPGYVCNHHSPRERDAASQGHTSGIPIRAMLYF